MFFFKHKFSHIKQPDSMECGATCLRMVARHYGKIYSAEYMRRLCAISHIGVSMQSMNEAAKSIGFQTLHPLHQTHKFSGKNIHSIEKVNRVKG